MSTFFSLMSTMAGSTAAAAATAAGDTGASAVMVVAYGKGGLFRNLHWQIIIDQYRDHLECFFAQLCPHFSEVIFQGFCIGPLLSFSEHRSYTVGIL